MDNTENKKIISSISETFTLSVIMMSIFNFVFEDKAADVSQLSELFALCGKGLTIKALAQILVMATIVSLLRYFWFSDRFFKNMMKLWRTTFMLGSALLTMFALAMIFRWFPPHVWQAWVGGLVGFTVSTLFSFLVMYIKTKLESNAYQKNFDEYVKNEEENNNEYN